MEVKDEFCPSLNPRYYLLDSTDPDDYLSRDNLFDMRSVENILTSPQDERMIISVTGTRTMKRSRLECMRQLTPWYSLFPIEFTSVIPYLRDIVSGTLDLCTHLGFPPSFFHTLEKKYPGDIQRIKAELVCEWMSSTSRPPCWRDLAEALRKTDMIAQARKIETEYSESQKWSI